MCPDRPLSPLVTSVDAQLEAFETVLAHPEVQRRTPIVLIHHPPVDTRPRHRAAARRAGGRRRVAQFSGATPPRARPLRPPSCAGTLWAPDAVRQARCDRRKWSGPRSSRQLGPRRVQPVRVRRRQPRIRRGACGRSPDRRLAGHGDQPRNRMRVTMESVLNGLKAL